MTPSGPEVKRTTKVADWIDRHPRLGWYVGCWMLLVGLNAVLDVYSKLSHLLT